MFRWYCKLLCRDYFRLRVYANTLSKVSLNRREYSFGVSPTVRVVRGLDLGEADDAAGDARAGVARGLAELVAAAPEVVGVRVHHQRAPDHAVRARQGD